MRVPLSPYSLREFVPMVWRRFTGPPPRPASIDWDVRLHAAAADFTMGFVGDICPLFGREARFGDGVRDFLSDCNMLIGNFEGIFSGRAWQPFLMKHAPDIFPVLAQLRPLDCWIVSVANNHATDYGPEDFERTLRRLDRHDIRWLGTSDQPRLRLTDDVTLTAWTEWLNRPGEGVARCDPEAPAESGLHIAFPHWGYEHERTPRPTQTCPSGYSLTAGHHSHLPQPFEVRPDGSLVAWSLGNFVTGKQLPVLGEGALLKVDVARMESGSPRIARARYREIELDRTRRQCHVRLRHPEPPTPTQVALDNDS